MPGPPPATVKPFPCLSFGATELLEHFADGRSVVEFGSGGSTLWLAKFAWSVHSFETDAAWFATLSSQTLAIDNIRIEFVDQAEAGTVSPPAFDVAFIDSFEPTRQPFLLAALRQATKGAVVVADDSHFPSVAAVVEKLDRDRYEVEELTGRKMHPTKGIPVVTRTAFIRVR